MLKNNQKNQNNYKEAPYNLAKLAVRACLEAKGSNISVLDVSEVFSLADYFVIVSGRSDRQVQGICNRITEQLQRSGEKPHLVEGFDNGHWILMDYGDVIIHVFYEQARAEYDIEGLWMKANKLNLVENELERLKGQRAA